MMRMARDWHSQPESFRELPASGFNFLALAGERKKLLNERATPSPLKAVQS